MLIRFLLLSAVSLLGLTFGAATPKAADAPKSLRVELLPDTLGEDSDLPLEGMPVALGEKVRIAYVCHGSTELTKANLVYRVLRQRDGKDASKKAAWLKLALVSVKPADGAGAFNARTGVFRNTKFDEQVPFHALPAANPPAKEVRVLGGGRVFLETRGLIVDQEKPVKLESGDRIEYYIEVTAIARQPGGKALEVRSSARITDVVTEIEVLEWYRRAIDEDKRLRDLLRKQKDLLRSKEKQSSVRAAGPANSVAVTTPLSPPTWSLLQCQLLAANSAACREFYAKYFDERGWLLCVERWGGDDGPDDAIENCTDWPILHALGGHDDVLKLYKKAWEGHLRQFTLAKTKDVDFARDGMYYKEFPVKFDWLHNGEGLVVFNLQGLSDPYDRAFQQRARRFAGFYMNEDPDAPNYDPKHKIIKSLFNGSRGPLLRKATGLDWAGDPFEVGNRFKLGHGERTYQECLDHFKDYNDIVGDHPSNLLSTVLATNAYMLPVGQAFQPDDQAGKPDLREKYKAWLLEYVDAWLDRIKTNNGIIPTNIGLDGKIGSAAGGKWYGGVYGWGFSVIVPQTGKLAHRNTSFLGLNGFLNAYLLTGNDKYLDGWRKQIDKINANKKVIDGQTQYPHMFGDKGWYDFKPAAYQLGALEIYSMSLTQDDRKRIVSNPWLDYLEGKNAGYAEQVLRGDLERVRTRIAGMRKDTTTPDTRLADDPLKFNPASVDSLIEVAMGGLPPKNRGKLLFAQLRYFDPAKRRAGLPEGVAALIDKITPDGVEVTLVNTNALDARTVIVQAGGYGEHQFVEATANGKTTALNGPHLSVRLDAGCGSRLVLKMRRFVNQPTLALPWGS